MSEEKLAQLEHELYEEMGLTSEMIKSIRTLCPKCLNLIWDTGAFWIIRVPSADGNKDTCTLCQIRRGFDYVVLRR